MKDRETKESKEQRIYNVPEDLMSEIVNLINSLPYGQVAPLATKLGAFLAREQAKLDKKRIITPIK